MRGLGTQPLGGLLQHHALGEAGVFRAEPVHTDAGGRGLGERVCGGGDLAVLRAGGGHEFLAGRRAVVDVAQHRLAGGAQGLPGPARDGGTAGALEVEERLGSLLGDPAEQELVELRGHVLTQLGSGGQSVVPGLVLPGDLVGDAGPGEDPRDLLTGLVFAQVAGGPSVDEVTARGIGLKVLCSHEQGVCGTLSIASSAYVTLITRTRAPLNAL
ncbi:hypothetical protein ACFFX0_09525 [Citricoccus parietis]|uniref:Uncharacterized protein n=1 Tax=Citricoccus parietis TaxID=592307 RepID=A0ABV5FXM9_9MICC